MNSLTKREKVLLYILLCFLLLIGGIYLLVIPAVNKYQKSADEYQTAYSTKRQIDQITAGYEETQKSLEGVRQKAESESAYFYPVMDNEKIDQMITNLMLKHSLTPVSFSMTQTEERTLSAYQSGNSQSSSSESGEEEGSASSGDSQSKEEQGPSLLTNTVSMQFRGDRDHVIAMVDELSSMTSVMINSISMDNSGKNDLPYSITLQIYMMEPVDME